LITDGRRPSRQPALEIKQRLFGPHPTWNDVFAMGPRPHLVGRPVADLELAAPSEAHAFIAGARRFDQVDPSSEQYPGYIEGHVEGSGLAEVDVAIAVNGVVRAVTWPWAQRDERLAFAVLLPEASFTPGLNTVDVYSIEGADRLSNVPRLTYTLTEDVGGALRIERSDGMTYPVVSDAIRSLVDHADVEDGVLNLGGWAYEKSTNEAARTVLLFVEGSARAIPIPSGRSVGENSKLPERSRFGLRLSTKQLGTTLAGRLRAYALTDRIASEVNYGKKGQWLRNN
jgi:hypothetical protein